MRDLPAGPEPAILGTERARIRATPGVGDDWYGQLSTAAKDAVRAQRMIEQGNLCAYTEIRLAYDEHHIEHEYPQAHSTPPESIDYSNIVVCYPRGRNPGFGAVEKADWPSFLERHLFVKPVGSSCGTRFRFENDGRMIASNAADAAAKETIRVLKLDEFDPDDPQSGFLRKSRREAIISATKGIKTVDEAQKRLKALGRDGNGELPQFVSAKTQALERLLRKLAQHRKYAVAEKNAK